MRFGIWDLGFGIWGFGFKIEVYFDLPKSILLAIILYVGQPSVAASKGRHPSSLILRRGRQRQTLLCMTRLWEWQKTGKLLHTTNSCWWEWLLATKKEARVVKKKLT